MKNVLSSLRQRLSVALILFSLPVIFAACMKKDQAEIPDVPAAGLMAFNLAPDQQSIVIQLSGNSLTQQPLAFTNYTGVYRNIYVGDRQVQTFDYPDANPLVSGNYAFADSNYYSLFVVGVGDNYKNIIVNDKLDSLPTGTGNAFIRYVNAVTDSANAPHLTVSSAGGAAILDETPAYGAVSEFTSVTPGDLAVAISSSNTDTSRNISVEANKVYTILLIGDPSAQDAFRRPQIKYIPNGTVAEENSAQ